MISIQQAKGVGFKASDYRHSPSAIRALEEEA
jgi:hypothetical protein